MSERSTGGQGDDGGEALKWEVKVVSGGPPSRLGLHVALTLAPHMYPGQGEGWNDVFAADTEKWCRVCSPGDPSASDR